MSVGIDLDGDDFSISPWLYPGTPGGHSGLLVGHAFVELRPVYGERVGRYRLTATEDGRRHDLDTALSTLDVAQTDERTLVVAIGSNASPAVMRRKFARAGVSRVAPLLRADLTGVAVGHSAHISRAGYVPAAPFARDGEELTVVVSLLDGDQLDVLDATEPNYTRTHLHARDHTLELENGERPEEFAVYVSTWGVVGGPDGHSDLDTQEAIADLLRERHPGYTRFSGEDDYADVMHRLARDEAQRRRLTEELAAEDLVHPSGLNGQIADDTPTYGQTPSTFAPPPRSDDGATAS